MILWYIRRVSDARARRVAFTGAASFLGQNLIGVLEDDARIERIVAFDVQAPATAAAKTLYCELDLTRPLAPERMAEVLADQRIDTIAHLAFLSSPSHASAWAHELESIGTMHTLTAAEQAGVRKLVLWSQTVLYGAWPTNPNFLTEKHPLRARKVEGFFADKMDAESEALRFGAHRPGRVVTILRTAPILGPTVKNYVTRYLTPRLVPTLMGFDPLWQLLHEVDAVAAFKLAIERDLPGTFNIAGDGVLPLSTVIKLAGRATLPLPGPLAAPLVRAVWATRGTGAPAGFLDYLRYVCVADTTAAAREMGFRPAHTTREAVLDFASVQRLRDARLLADDDRTTEG